MSCVRRVGEAGHLHEWAAAVGHLGAHPAWQLLISPAAAKWNCCCCCHDENSGETHCAVSHSFILHKQGLRLAKHPPPPAAGTGKKWLIRYNQVKFSPPCEVPLPGIGSTRPELLFFHFPAGSAISCILQGALSPTLLNPTYPVHPLLVTSRPEHNPAVTSWTLCPTSSPILAAKVGLQLPGDHILPI